MSLEIGTVREGKGGKKYSYVGGDEKSRDSWKELTPFVPSGEKEQKGAGDVALEAIGTMNEMVKGVNRFNPFMFAAEMTGKAVSPENAYKAGGEVTDVATNLGASPEVAAGAGYITNVGIQAVPTILSGNIAKPAVASITKPLGRVSMWSAVKPAKEAQLSGDAAKAVETMLKEGVNVSAGGMKKLSGEVGQLSARVDDLINAAEKSGATVSKVSILKAFKDELKKIAGPLDSADDVAQAKGVLKRVLEDPRFKDLDEIPIRMAQDLKSATYRSLGEKAYNQADNMTTAKVNSLKSVVRGLKEGIERAEPAVMAPNKRMQELLNAIEVVEPRALMKGNQNFGGLSYLAENLPAAGGFILDRSSLAKSILGRFLYSGAPNVARDVTRAGTAGILGIQEPD